MGQNWNMLDKNGLEALWHASASQIFKVLLALPERAGQLHQRWRNSAQVRQVEGIWLYWDRIEGYDLMLDDEVKSTFSLEPLTRSPYPPIKPPPKVS